MDNNNLSRRQIFLEIYIYIYYIDTQDVYNETVNSNFVVFRII